MIIIIGFMIYNFFLLEEDYKRRVNNVWVPGFHGSLKTLMIIEAKVYHSFPNVYL